VKNVETYFPLSLSLSLFSLCFMLVVLEFELRVFVLARQVLYDLSHAQPLFLLIKLVRDI
jgi:hypothetical protein